METAVSFVRKDRFIEKLMRSPVFWICVVLLLFTYPILRSVTRELPKGKPVIANVPAFSMINENGKPFGSNDLKGKVYLASFAFTTCPTTCPGLMKQLQKVQKRVRGLGQKVAIVTFTVDPENDSPEVLFKHARKYKANPYVWSFVTAEKKQMRELLVHGYKVPMGDSEEVTKQLDTETISLFDIAHTTKLVLVDGEGGIRGYYSTDKDSINHLMIDLGLLVNRES